MQGRQFSFRDFLDFAKKLCSFAESERGTASANPFIIGSILTSWIATESFINNMLRDFASLPEGMFTVHERGFLEEKQVRFASKGKKAGTFCLEDKEEFKRLEDKILFLIAKFGTSRRIKGTPLWQRFEKIKEKRNNLTHPRKDREIELTLQDAHEAIDVTKSIIEFVSLEVWKKPIKW